MGIRLQTVPEPKYRHLKTVIGEALDHEFRVGEVLPNERELAARFGVARATLRQALEQLELEGRLQRRRGVGTTVAPPRVGVEVGSENWPGAPCDPWQARDAHRALPPTAVAELLGTGDEPVHVLTRVRLDEALPVATELLYVPAASVPGLSAIDAPGGAARARAVLRELGHLGPEGEDRAVELGSAGAEDARRLDRLPGSPVLLVTTRFFAEGATAAVSVATYRADTCRLTFGADGAGVEIAPARQAS